MTDWVWPGGLTVLVIGFTVGGQMVWRRAGAVALFLVTIPLALLVVLDGVMIWYAASGGYKGV